jgi:hypothetical protein
MNLLVNLAVRSYIQTSYSMDISPYFEFELKGTGVNDE